jgi:hypothetical protein
VAVGKDTCGMKRARRDLEHGQPPSAATLHRYHHRRIPTPHQRGVACAMTLPLLGVKSASHADDHQRQDHGSLITTIRSHPGTY